MVLVNKTKHNTAGLRAMLYDYARKAHVSTRGLLVDVLPSRRHVHGWCDPARRHITLYLLGESTTTTIAFVWVHELAHLTPRNRKLYCHGHSGKGQAHANAIAERVTGQKSEDVKWHKKRDWEKKRYWPVYFTKAGAQEALKNLRYPFPKFPDKPRGDGWSFRISPKSKRGNYFIEEKHFKRRGK